jgi:peptidoglycan L-alanyl-D-glutamate endopeptidase CwlK
MDPRSEAQLGHVSPSLAAKVRSAADQLAHVGTFFLVVSGLRTPTEQDALYDQGRTGPGQIVTYARAGYSMHNCGLADAVPFLSSDSGALNWKANTPQFETMVAALKEQGLVWGGDWIHFKDDDHFQMPNLPDTPTDAMRADYGSGDQASLRAIWTKADQGVYAG